MRINLPTGAGGSDRNLIEYRKNVYSQSGEDGIIEEIFRRLGIASGWFVEFGAWDGKHLSNTFNLLTNKNWHGVHIEGSPKKYQDLLKTATEFPGKLHTICAMVGFSGEGKLDNLLAQTPLPKDFDVLSIDIDSYDWQVWNAMENYRPKLVIVECNSAIPIGVHSIHNPGVSQGTSFSAMVELGKSKGYSLVCHTGNCLFVLNELIPALKIDPTLLEEPNKLFNHTKYRKECLLSFGRKFLPKGIMDVFFKFNDRWREARRKVV